jgi:hypothetical protein
MMVPEILLVIYLEVTGICFLLFLVFTTSDAGLVEDCCVPYFMPGPLTIPILVLHFYSR